MFSGSDPFNATNTRNRSFSSLAIISMFDFVPDFGFENENT